MRFLLTFVPHQSIMALLSEAQAIRSPSLLQQLSRRSRSSARAFSTCQIHRSGLDPKPEDKKLRLPPRLLSEVDSKGRPLGPRRPGRKGEGGQVVKFPTYRIMFGVIFLSILFYDMVSFCPTPSNLNVEAKAQAADEPHRP